MTARELFGAIGAISAFRDRSLSMLMVIVGHSQALTL
jgi:hypothetical protein